MKKVVLTFAPVGVIAKSENEISLFESIRHAIPHKREKDSTYRVHIYGGEMILRGSEIISSEGTNGIDEYNPGDKIILLGNTWTVIAPGLALSDHIIDIRRFDPKSNDYEKSEIKRYLEQRLENQIKLTDE